MGEGGEIEMSENGRYKWSKSKSKSEQTGENKRFLL
jgi:hypothetical protein